MFIEVKILGGVVIIHIYSWEAQISIEKAKKKLCRTSCWNVPGHLIRTSPDVLCERPESKCYGESLEFPREWGGGLTTWEKFPCKVVFSGGRPLPCFHQAMWRWEIDQFAGASSFTRILLAGSHNKSFFFALWQKSLDSNCTLHKIIKKKHLKLPKHDVSQGSCWQVLNFWLKSWKWQNKVIFASTVLQFLSFNHTPDAAQA